MLGGVEVASWGQGKWSKNNVRDRVWNTLRRRTGLPESPCRIYLSKTRKRGHINTVSVYLHVTLCKLSDTMLCYLKCASYAVRSSSVNENYHSHIRLPSEDQESRNNFKSREKLLEMTG